MSIIPRPASNFNNDLYALIKQSEGFEKKVYSDTEGVPTIGIGYALLEKIQGEWRVRGYIDEQLQSAGINIQQSDRQTLQSVADALNSNNVAQARSLIQSSTFSFSLSNETQGRQLFDYIIPNYKAEVRQKIGDTLYQQLDGSKEMIALVSLAYNNPSLIGAKLIAALQSGDRDEAWHEIRYNSNNGGSRCKGLANRRYRES
ncbi:MAG: lysozyme, partial [Candidatus Omnitrophica bacterium]|nr:lysozyme [Candidatus Omnitrophota bacterium]